MTALNVLVVNQPPWRAPAAVIDPTARAHQQLVGQAVMADLGALPHVAARLLDSPTARARRLAAAVQAADAVWLLAAGTGARLRQRSQQVIDSKRMLLGSRPAALRVSGSLLRTSRILARSGVAVAATHHPRQLPAKATGAWLVRRDDASGWADSQLFASAAAARSWIAEQDALLMAADAEGGGVTRKCVQAARLDSNGQRRRGSAAANSDDDPVSLFVHGSPPWPCAPRSATPVHRTAAPDHKPRCVTPLCTDFLCSNVLCSNVLCADLPCSNVPCSNVPCSNVLCSNVHRANVHYPPAHYPDGLCPSMLCDSVLGPDTHCAAAAFPHTPCHLAREADPLRYHACARMAASAPSHPYAQNSQRRYVMQAYVAGQSGSLTLLCRDGVAHLLACNAQHMVARDQRLHELGTTVNGLRDARGALAALAGTIAAAMPDLWGFADVQFVLSPRGPVVLDVSAVPGLWYAGLHASLGRNPAALLLDLLLPAWPASALPDPASASAVHVDIGAFDAR